MSAGTARYERMPLWPWFLRGLRLLMADVRKRWWAFALFGLAWGLAAVRVFYHHMPVLPVMVNWTPSLPYHVVYVDFWPGALQRGDLIVFPFTGPAGSGAYPGLKEQPFFKRVCGLPGDLVEVRDRDVFVNGRFVGRAKTHAYDRLALDPISPGLIPEGYVYVQGTSADSFDSRYRQSGLVPLSTVKAKAYPLF